MVEFLLASAGTAGEVLDNTACSKDPMALSLRDVPLFGASSSKMDMYIYMNERTPNGYESGHAYRTADRLDFGKIVIIFLIFHVW